MKKDDKSRMYRQAKEWKDDGMPVATIGSEKPEYSSSRTRTIKKEYPIAKPLSKEERNAQADKWLSQLNRDRG